MEDLTNETARAEELKPDEPGELRPRKERALLAVIAHPVLRDAALAAGVSETTLWRYMRDRDFARRLGEARGASVTHASVQLQGASGEAVKTLRDLMGREDAPAASRVSAARAVLEHSFRARVVDELQAEVERLKELLGEDQGEPGAGGGLE
jgi:hypothetical protein